MSIKLQETSIPDVLLVEPRVFSDSRGFFLETFHGKKYAEQGIERSFIQDNFSHSSRGILRGLHYQLKYPQAKLIYVVTGEIFDVAVDIRRGSPTFGKWTGAYLSAKNKSQIFIPEGFAHGFYVISAEADVIYKCSEYYVPGDEYGVIWSDAEIGIEWPLEETPVLSDKDEKFPRLNDMPKEHLPVYEK